MQCERRPVTRKEKRKNTYTNRGSYRNNDKNKYEIVNRLIYYLDYRNNILHIIFVGIFHIIFTIIIQGVSF